MKPLMVFGVVLLALWVSGAFLHLYATNAALPIPDSNVLSNLSARFGASTNSTAWNQDRSKYAAIDRGDIYRFGDTAVVVSDASTGKQLLFLHHDGRVASISWSPDGKIIASGSLQNVEGGGLAGFGGSRQGSNPNTLILWDALTGSQLAKIKRDWPVEGIAWGPDGKSIAVQAKFGGVVTWSAQGLLLSASLWNASMWCFVSAGVGTLILVYKYRGKPKGRTPMESARKQE